MQIRHFIYKTVSFPSTVFLDDFFWDVHFKWKLVLLQQPNSLTRLWPFKRQYHKMVKHTQTIRRQIAILLDWCSKG